MSVKAYRKYIPSTLPVLKIKTSNNYDMGYKIGSTIGRFDLENFDDETRETLDQFYKTEETRAVFDEFVGKTTECYPNVVEEIRGIAEASGVTMDEYFLSLMVSEITLTTAWLTECDPYDDEVAGCTDVLVNTEECRLVAHNEDWTTDVSAQAYMIDVDIERTEDDANGPSTDCEISEILQARNERFFSFVFPGELAGMTFAMNRHFVFTINSLVPQQYSRGSVILFVLLRALLRCETIEECQQVMECEPYGCSYGININIASIATTDMWSMEVYPRERKPVINLLHLPLQTGDEERKQYVHTNHYKHLDDVEECTQMDGSKAREAVGSAAPTPTCIEDVCKILGDRSSKIQPIFRIPTAKKHVVTACSAVFDMNAKKLYIYVGNPAVEGNLKMTVPFIE